MRWWTITNDLGKLMNLLCGEDSQISTILKCPWHLVTVMAKHGLCDDEPYPIPWLPRIVKWNFNRFPKPLSKFIFPWRVNELGRWKWSAKAGQQFFHPAIHPQIHPLIHSPILIHPVAILLTSNGRMTRVISDTVSLTYDIVIGVAFPVHSILRFGTH